MIRTTYVVECNECDEVLCDPGLRVPLQTDLANEMARKAGWFLYGYGHLCPACLDAKIAEIKKAVQS